MNPLGSSIYCHALHIHGSFHGIYVLICDEAIYVHCVSVLPLLTIWISSSDRDLVRSNFSISVGSINADGLFISRVMHSYSLVGAIEYELS